MSEKLDFRLPDEVTRPGRPRMRRGPSTFLLLLILIAVVVLGALSLRQSRAPRGRRGGSESQRERELAAKLQDRGLSLSAAELWLKYLATTKLDPKEEATVYYQVGKLYQEAGDFEQALVNYYRCEAAAKLEDLQLEISRRKRECFRRLGNIAGLNRELESMTALPSPEAPKDSGGEVVAEIGPEKITMEDLNRRIDRLVDIQLKQFSAYMSKEELNKQKERLVDQFQSKEAKFRVLEEIVARQVLLREAVKHGLDKKQENEEAIEEFRESFLANKVLDAETVEKVNVTESDLRDYYGAHKEEFREKAKVEISQIVTAKEEEGENVVLKLKEGKSFEECAKEFSIDEGTKENGGKVEGEIEKGGAIPGIGENVDVHAHLFGLKENEVSSRPVKVGEKFYVFKVRKSVPETTKPFEEVKSEVERRKTRDKVREVQEGLIQRLEAEHNVIIHRSKFVPEKPESEEGPKEEKKGGWPVPPPGTI